MAGPGPVVMQLPHCRRRLLFLILQLDLIFADSGIINGGWLMTM